MNIRKASTKDIPRIKELLQQVLEIQQKQKQYSVGIHKKQAMKNL